MENCQFWIKKQLKETSGWMEGYGKTMEDRSVEDLSDGTRRVREQVGVWVDVLEVGGGPKV